MSRFRCFKHLTSKGNNQMACRTFQLLSNEGWCDTQLSTITMNLYYRATPNPRSVFGFSFICMQFRVFNIRTSEVILMAKPAFWACFPHPWKTVDCNAIFSHSTLAYVICTLRYMLQSTWAHGKRKVISSSNGQEKRVISVDIITKKYNIFTFVTLHNQLIFKLH